jgi:hypothetical protein
LPEIRGGFAAVSVPQPAQRFYGHEQHLADALSAACLDMQLALASAIQH